MRLNRLTSILAVAFLILIAVCAQAQTLPDYSKWDKESGPIFPNLNGKITTLTTTYYSHTDLENLKRYSVSVLNDEKDNPWLAYYTEETGEKHPDGRVSTKSARQFLFKYLNNKWTLVRDFSKSIDVDKDLANFLREEYKLEFENR